MTLGLCRGTYADLMGVVVSYVDALVPGFGGDAAAQPSDGRGHRAGPRLGGLVSGYEPLLRDCEYEAISKLGQDEPASS